MCFCLIHIFKKYKSLKDNLFNANFPDILFNVNFYNAGSSKIYLPGISFFYIIILFYMQFSKIYEPFWDAISKASFQDTRMLKDFIQSCIFTIMKKQIFIMAELINMLPQRSVAIFFLIFFFFNI